MKQLYDSLRCNICNKKFGKGQPMYDTAWSGVYWCGSKTCAPKLLKRCCKRLKLSDHTNYDEE